MMQCRDCEYYQEDPDGRRSFTCDPFKNIKEPECIQKWQLMRLDMLSAGYQQMLQFYQKMQPMQDKIFRHIGREMDDIDEADNWKYKDDEDRHPDDFL